MSIWFSVHFGALFLAVGIKTPFWPVWLDEKGMTAQQIGIILAVAFWGKVITGFILTSLADQEGKRKKFIVFISLAYLFGLIVLRFVDGYWPILTIWGIAGALYAVAVPLSDSLSVIAIRRHGLNYGRVRLWGSITFILGTTTTGWMVGYSGANIVLDMLTLSGVLLVLSSMALPDLTQKRPLNVTFKDKLNATLKGLSAFGDVFKIKGFLAFALAAAFIQSSHAVLYGFGTIYWREAGISDGLIGLFWAEGVIFEIILFIFANKLWPYLNVRTALIIAGIAGILRWGVLAFSLDPVMIAVMQSLHALTFAATHLAGIQYMSKFIPEDMTARAQGAFDAIIVGVVFGSMMLVAGFLYKNYAGNSFLIMALSCAIGMLFLPWIGKTIKPTQA